MQRTKDFRIEFLQGSLQSDENLGHVSDLLLQFATEGCASLRIDTYTYKLSHIVSAGDGQSFKGTLAKYRADSLPYVGAPGGEEREINLADDENLIEKNQFLYFSHAQLLVFQTNVHGSKASMFARYLSGLGHGTVWFAPVLQPDSLARLVANNGRPRSIEISYAAPSDAVISQAGHELSRDLLCLLTATGAQRARIKITPPRRGFLNLDLPTAMTRIMDDLDVRKAKVTVSEDGVDNVIDLIADRLFGQETVRMSGQYPVPEEMFNALRRSYDQNKETLDRIVQRPHNDGG